jgi:FkbH-like protein
MEPNVGTSLATQLADLIARGELDAAEQLLDTSGGVAEQYVKLARAWTLAQHTDRAEKVLRRAATLSPAVGLPALARFLQRAGQPEQALASYLAAVDAAPTQKTYLTVAQSLADLEPELPAAKPGRAIRIALLGNATLDHLQSYLTVDCYRAGLRPTIYQAGFDQYTQEILDPRSGLYAFAPDVVVCAIHASRLFPNLHRDPSALPVSDRRAELDSGLRQIQHLLDTFTQRSSALVLLHNMVLPQFPALGILDLREELGQTAAFSEINLRLAELARTRYQNVYLVDEDRIQSQSGKRTATDARLWYTARMSWSDGVLRGLASEYLRYLRAARGLNRKCVVVDLDNTLWSGVIGEDGLAGIQLGADAPGNAFVALQSELEKLWRRGILLAIASKNNLEDAQAALEQHPDMLLRPSHFAAQRINWNSKAANIRAIALELNIGLDSLVFLDDNPVERAHVRAELPQVLVPELPTDPADYRACLLELGVFDTLALTNEDRQRNQLYADQKARREAEAQLGAGGTVDDYLADLDLVVEIETANPLNLARIAQLTNKTNQFNLTTRRYTEAEIADRLARGWRVFGARVKDRFGDNGLTGLIMLTPSSDAWIIDTLLLSCRVMGRRVETALLAVVADEALRNGATRLRGWFYPTEKNAPARDVYRDHGFVIREHGPDDSVLWELDLHADVPSVPDWLTVRNAAVAA